MPDALSKVKIPVPIPGIIPHIDPVAPLPPPPLIDDPSGRIRAAMEAARNKPRDLPPYTPNPMSNIEDDLKDHPGFFEDQRTKYDPFHVELILDGAGDILGRALGDRAAYDQFRDRYYERSLELNYLQSQIELDEREFQVGVWDRAVKQADADLASVNARIMGLEGRRASRDAALLTPPFNVAQQATVIANGVRAAMSGAFKSTTTEIAMVAADGTPGGAVVAAHQLVYDSNNASANAALTREILGLELEKEGELDLIEAVKGQALLAEESTRIEADLRELRKRRFSALQAYQAEKTKALTDPDGPHNALVQMKAIQDRFSRDMVDLWDRLQSVALGLELIYGLKLPPSSPTECAEQKASFLDISVAWVRNVVRYLNARATQDRTITLSYSLLHLVGKVVFDEALGKARETHKGIQLTFTIPIPEISVLRFPRLRGVSCYGLYSDANYHGVFSLRLTPPSYAYMALSKVPLLFIEGVKWPNPTLPKIRGNSVGGNDARPWDEKGVFTMSGEKLVRVQKNRTPAFVSRVGSRLPLRAPEISSTDSLFNISPFGAPAAPGADPEQWTIDIDATTSIGSEVAASLIDLELDFYLLATPE